MTIQNATGFGTTRDIIPGTEVKSERGVTIHNRVFVDVMESSDPALAGQNEVTLTMDMGPHGGSFRGTFNFTLTSGGGWDGELLGKIEAGKVVSQGVALGRGERRGQVLRIDWTQVDTHPATAPCSEPKAFFAIVAAVYEP